MAAAKYEPIYLTIKNDILSGKYAFCDILPSENQYTEVFDCTRNTVRRALSMLAAEGYVQPIHGKGVQVIYQNDNNTDSLNVSGLESAMEEALRNGRQLEIQIRVFRQMIVGNALHFLTGFETGSPVYYIERVRLLNGVPEAYDTCIFLKSEMPGLSREAAARSIFQFIENRLDISVSTASRRITAEKANEKDMQYLYLNSNEPLLVISDQLFSSKGIMFGYCQSRYKADSAIYRETVTRMR